MPSPPHHVDGRDARSREADQLYAALHDDVLVIDARIDKYLVANVCEVHTGLDRQNITAAGLVDDDLIR